MEEGAGINLSNLADSFKNLLKRQENPNNAAVKKMAAELFAMRFDDEVGIDNSFFEKFLEAYVAVSFDKIALTFEYIWEKQEDTKRSYGDDDYTITKVFDGKVVSERRKSQKEDEEPYAKHVRVLYYDDHVTTGEHSRYLIFREGEPDDRFATYHIRIAYNKSDYKKGNNYVMKPNLKWYKDRKWDLDFRESLHLTPLGGSYADGRDKGYVLTAKRFYSTEWQIDCVKLDKFKEYRFICEALSYAEAELRDNNQWVDDEEDIDENKD